MVHVFNHVWDSFWAQNLPKMSPNCLQKPSQGATIAKSSDFEKFCFVLFFAINLEHQASQDSPKTAKKPPKVPPDGHQEPFQKASLQPASPLHVLVPDLPGASMAGGSRAPPGARGFQMAPEWLPGGSQRLPAAPRNSQVAPRWLPGASQGLPDGSQVAPREPQEPPRWLPGAPGSHPGPLGGTWEPPGSL